MSYKVFPYIHFGQKYNRLIIAPIQIPERETASGLKVPAHNMPGAGFGKIFATCDGSTFNIGDEVQYLVADRAGKEHLSTISIDDKVYDVIYEHKIWAVNDEPYNQIFIQPLSGAEVSESGLLIPSTVECVSRKGIVFKAPAYLNLKPGDRVEYQNQVKGYYPEATIDGTKYEVLFISDIFKINDVVAPYRIIVKIDRALQSIKRNSTAAGLSLSPLFMGMLRNLQHAEVIDMGEEAMKMYPELNIGDTAIIDHGVESQDYRLVKYDIGKNDTFTYEYRIINCFSPEDREIFGKLHYSKKTNKIISITPLGGSVFLEWNFSMFEDSTHVSELLDTDNTLSQYNNADDLRSVIRAQRANAAEKAKLKTSGIRQVMARTSNKDQYDVLESEFLTIEREEKRIAAFLHKNHWVVCKTVHPRHLPPYMISPYEELYPINILGHKFLIGHEDFLLFKSTKNMNIKSGDMIPLKDNVLVLPIKPEKESELVIPDTAQEKPQYGTVVLIGNNDDGVEAGHTILFRKGAGLLQEVDGIPHLVMKQNDMLMAIPINK